MGIFDMLFKPKRDLTLIFVNLFLKRIVYILISISLLVGLIGAGGCGKSEIKQAFDNKIPQIAKKCQMILSMQREASIQKDYLSGPILILSSWPEPTFKQAIVEIYSDAYSFVPPNEKELPRELPERLLAKRSEELKTIVWVVMDAVPVGKYTGGSTALRTDMDVWLIDLERNCLTGHKYFQGYSPPAVTHSSGAAGFPSLGKLRQWLISLPLKDMTTVKQEKQLKHFPVLSGKYTE